jgi:Phosphoinositide phospholipase C, Ca2+-dependent
VPSQYHAAATEEFTPATLDALDEEIRSVFTADKMVTPDDVCGTLAMLGFSNGDGLLSDKRAAKLSF